MQAPAAAADTTLRTLAAARGIKIGTAVAAGPLTGEPGYQDKARYEFNSLTPENAMKWSWVEAERDAYTWADPDSVVGFAQANGQAVRGHALVWHNAVPSWVTGGAFTDAQLRDLLKKHVETMTKRYAGRVGVWDVVNEAVAEDGTLRDSFWLRRLGESYIADAFRWARAADPSAKLYINDYNAEWDNAKSDGLYTLVKGLKASGVPIDGVGFQTHATTNSGLTQLAATLQRFAALGLDVAVTELDVRMPLPSDETKLATQATLYERAAKACLAVARCVSLTVWGFTDAHSWVPDALPGWGAATMLDAGLQAKPAYDKVHAALGARDFRSTAVASHSGRCLAVPGGDHRLRDPAHPVRLRWRERAGLHLQAGRRQDLHHRQCQERQMPGRLRCRHVQRCGSRARVLRGYGGAEVRAQAGLGHAGLSAAAHAQLQMRRGHRGADRQLGEGRPERLPGRSSGEEEPGLAPVRGARPPLVLR
nr:endo-1,4-beta-xylanase [Nonomuraea sp. PA05]